jgi:proteasome beta subunit
LTVVLAVKCREGVVLAADSQATDTSGGNLSFATKHPMDKLFPLGTHIAWGGTGSGGIIQRFGHFCTEVPQGVLDTPIEELRETLAGFQRNMQQQVRGEIIEGFYGQQVPALGVLFAGYTGGRPWILEVTPGGEDTEYNEYYSVGSGGVFAQQAMISVTHYDVRNRNLAEAEVIAWRALDGTIEASAFGIGHPITMYSITDQGARALSEDDLRGVRDTVNTWKAAERDSLVGLGLGAPLPAVAEPDDTGLEPEPMETAAPESAGENRE